MESLLNSIVCLPWEALERSTGQQILSENIGPKESLTILNGDFESSVETINNKTKDDLVDSNKIHDYNKELNAKNKTYSIDENNTDKMIKYSCEYCVFKASLKSQLTQP